MTIAPGSVGFMETRPWLGPPPVRSVHQPPPFLPHPVPAPASSATGTPTPPLQQTMSGGLGSLYPFNDTSPAPQYTPQLPAGTADNTSAPSRLPQLAIAVAIALAIALGVHLIRKHHHHHAAAE